MKSDQFPLRGLAVAACLLTFLNLPVDAQQADDGLKCPDGFEATQFSDDAQASDVYCITIDSRGRVVAAGADYIRILADTDNDGIADKVTDFADCPEGGVQGMCFDGSDLYCSGGGGIIRFRDANGDDRADGPAELLFTIKTGNEHDAHAIRKGPDGWWYMTAGNFAGVKSADINSGASPVTKVREGVIMRFSPDFSRREVFAHGFRNSYDFDFDSFGNLFNFESDGERDVSLPWYRPTRVFHVTPGSDAGHISHSWKKPNHYFEMPDTIAELGRGSPTGVVCYQHDQFPQEYRDAIFVLDWTFGAVKCIRTKYRGAEVESDVFAFLEGKGAFGFAPTDAEIGPDGSLYVSVGGRGTRGSIYRVRWTGDASSANSKDDDLTRCLAANQPLSSWSRAQWEPIAKRLGKQTFVDAIVDTSLPVPQRCRAASILTDLFSGPDPADLAKLVAIEDPTVQAMAAWSIGRTADVTRDADAIVQLLKHPEPAVRTFLLRGLCGKTEVTREVASTLLLSLHAEQRSLRQAASRFLVPARVVLTRSKDDPLKIRKLYSSEWLSLILARDAVDSRCINAGLGFFEAADSQIDRLDAVRLMQLGLGDAGPRTGIDPVFEGYVSSKTATPVKDVDIEVLRKLVGLFPSQEETVDIEIARLCSIAGLNSPTLLKRMLDKITDESQPVSDIHYLICGANLPVARLPEDRARIAAALVNLQQKIETADLNQDNNWEPRIEELGKRYQTLDPMMISAIIGTDNFGHPAHAMFLKDLPSQVVNAAIPKFIAFQERSETQHWTPQLLRYLADSPVAAHRQLVRNQFSDPGCRDDVVLTLARKPNEIDRAIYVNGLRSPEPNVIGASLNALNVMRPSREADEQVALVQALQRLGGDKSDYEARERIVRLLQKNTGISFGFQFGETGYRPQTEVVNLWINEIKRRYPDMADQLEPEEGIGPAQVAALLANVPWQHGKPENGARIFEERTCAKCHGKRNMLGPDLAGVTKRFSTNDLFLAILAPSATVSSRYRTRIYDMVDGKSYTGMVIYESVEGVLLRTSNNETLRLEHDEIEASGYLSRSLMPSKLLDNLSPQDYADLYAFLQKQ